MSNEDEGTNTGVQTLQEKARNLEEKIFDAKDATLRLWERNRHLQTRIGGLETRVRLLLWLALGLLLGSAIMFAVIVKGQVSPLQRQVIVLQETVDPLRARIEEVDQALKTEANTTPATIDDATVKRLEHEVLESVKKLAPEILAAANEGEPVSAVNDSGETHRGSTVGTVTGPTGEPLRLAVGRTDPQKTNWRQYNRGGIYVDIDTSSAGFSSTPYYFTSLSGHTNNWMAQGVTSIYLPTAKGFRVHVGYRELTAAQAKQWGWSISWIAVGN